MNIAKHPTKKVFKEVLWKIHEGLQAEFKPINEWYKMNSEIIETMDYERQKIVRKYFRFQFGELMRDKKGEFILIHGMKLKDYDREMEELMTGEVEIEDNGAIKWPTSYPAPQMEVVEQENQKQNEL